MILDILIPIKDEIGDFFKFTKVEDIGPLLTNIISVSISIAAILLLIYLIWSGIQWLTSGGEKTAVAAARDRMTNAFIGLIIVLSAWAIFTLVKYLFGIPSGTEESPSEPKPPCPTANYLCLTRTECRHEGIECDYNYSCPTTGECCCKVE